MRSVWCERGGAHRAQPNLLLIFGGVNRTKSSLIYKDKLTGYGVPNSEITSNFQGIISAYCRRGGDLTCNYRGVGATGGISVLRRVAHDYTLSLKLVELTSRF